MVISVIHGVQTVYGLRIIEFTYSERVYSLALNIYDHRKIASVFILFAVILLSRACYV